MTSPYAKFQANADEEKQGVALDFGDFQVIVRRAGGANMQYQKVAAAVLQPYQRALKLGAVDEAKAEELQREIFAKAIVGGWRVRTEDGEFEDGIHDPETGEVVELTWQLAAAVFEVAPEIFNEVRGFATDFMNFRTEDDKAAVGN